MQPLSGSYSLHHTYDNPDPGCDLVAFTHDPLQPDSGFSCSFRVRHGYPPSSSNSWQVAMLADISLDTFTEGIVLGVNQTGTDDHLTLWQWDQGNSMEICHTSLNYQERVGESASARFSLDMDSDGEFSIWYYPEQGSEGSLVGAGQLTGWPGGRQLVIRYKYSSAQDRKLWLDDITLEGAFMKDTLPPGILSAEVVTGEQIELLLSESPREPGCEAFQLQRPGGKGQQPVTCQVAGEEVTLRFDGEIPNREWVLLRVNGVCDRDGNCLSDTTISLRRNEAVWGDLVWNEVMADPAPPVQLPDREYVELYNRSGESLTLTGWQLAVNGRVYLLDDLEVDPGLQLLPGQYVVLCGINLPNEGGELVLLNGQGVLILSLIHI